MKMSRFRQLKWGRQRQGVQRKGEDPMLIAWLYGVKRYFVSLAVERLKK